MVNNLKILSLLVRSYESLGEASMVKIAKLNRNKAIAELVLGE